MKALYFNPFAEFVLCLSMYPIKPHIGGTEDFIRHTDNMYKIKNHMSVLSSEPTSNSGNQLDNYIVNKSGARSKLGQALEAKKHEQGSKSEKPKHETEKVRFKVIPPEVTRNEMRLDRFIIRKRAPVSKLGKFICSNQGKECHSTSDSKLLHRLEELEQSLDFLLVPMGLIKSSKHVSPSLFEISGVAHFPSHLKGKQHSSDPVASSGLNKHLEVSKVPEPHPDSDPKLIHRLEEFEQSLDSLLVPMGLIDSSKHLSSSLLGTSKVADSHAQPIIPVDEPTVASVVAPGITLQTSFTPNFVDLAIHCDPKTPPFSILLYSKMLQLAGHNISLQFYKHSSPKYLPQLERFFVGQPRSSSAELILSVIWRPCPLGCLAISNPFTDLPLYGESIILMFLSRSSNDFAESFKSLAEIDSAISSKSEQLLSECIKNVVKTANEPFSVEELALFVLCGEAGLSSLLQKISKSWFGRCMSIECIATTKKLMDICH